MLGTAVVELLVALDVELVLVLEGIDELVGVVESAAWVLVLFELDPPQPATAKPSTTAAAARILMGFTSRIQTELLY